MILKLKGFKLSIEIEELTVDVPEPKASSNDLQAIAHISAILDKVFNQPETISDQDKETEAANAQIRKDILEVFERD